MCVVTTSETSKAKTKSRKGVTDIRNIQIENDGSVLLSDTVYNVYNEWCEPVLMGVGISSLRHRSQTQR